MWQVWPCSFLKPDSAFYDAGSVLSPGPSHLGQATKLGLAECKVNTRGIFLRCWEAGVTTLTSISSSTQAGRGHSMNNHRFNASTREAGAGRALWVWGQPDTDSGFQGSSETCFLPQSSLFTKELLFVTREEHYRTPQATEMQNWRAPPNWLFSNRVPGHQASESLQKRGEI